MANAYYTFLDLYTRVSQKLGTGASPSGAALTRAKQIANSGIRRFLAAHHWSFKRPIMDDGSIVVNQGESEYYLPTDFVRLVGPITHDGAGAPVVTLTSDANVRNFRATNVTQATPYLFAVVADSDAQGVERLYKLIFAPLPNATYRLSYVYEQQPQDLSSDTDIPWGGTAHAETILAAALAAAEAMDDENDGVAAKEYEALLARSKQIDEGVLNG